MADNNGRILMDLLKLKGNSECVDCGKSGPEYASYNLGIFLCTRCATCHRHMGAQVSKIKHLKMDTWEDAQVARMKEVGNMKSKLKYERWVPPSYRKVSENTPQVLVEQFIFSKYKRQEFIHPERQSYTSGFMEGYLMKKGRENNQFLPRKFVLSEIENTLKYYVKDRKDPKAIIKISDINVEFSPDKIPFPNSLQIDYIKDGSTRHIYVYHDDPQTVVNWYHAIRCCKLHLLQVAYPGATDTELIEFLSQDFDREGFLYKTGPSPKDVYKKRWCSLQGRKLMYHDEVLAAYPKGEIFLGHISAGYNVVPGFVPGFRESGYGFTLHTPDRAYQFSSETDVERSDWIQSIERVLKTTPKPQDNALAAVLNKKRTDSLAFFNR
jgi:hypothetical protein